MGCFLTITPNDFARLSASLKASVSVVESRPGQMKIEVEAVSYKTAREMARLIRSQAKSAQVTAGTVNESRWSVPTAERFQYVVKMMGELSRSLPAAQNLLFENIQNQYRTTMARAGKLEAEAVAANILVQRGHLDGGQKYTITRSTGVDIQGKNVAGTQVVVEVKLSTQEKDFGKMMRMGAYKDEDHPSGRRQMSNDWLGKVSDGFDASKAHILGVHINPLTETVTIYRREDAEAKNWTVLVTQPLSDYKL